MKWHRYDAQCNQCRRLLTTAANGNVEDTLTLREFSRHVQRIHCSHLRSKYEVTGSIPERGSCIPMGADDKEPRVVSPEPSTTAHLIARVVLGRLRSINQSTNQMKSHGTSSHTLPFWKWPSRPQPRAYWHAIYTSTKRSNAGELSFVPVRCVSACPRC